MSTKSTWLGILHPPRTLIARTHCLVRQCSSRARWPVATTRQIAVKIVAAIPMETATATIIPPPIGTAAVIDLGQTRQTFTSCHPKENIQVCLRLIEGIA